MLFAEQPKVLLSSLSLPGSLHTHAELCQAGGEQREEPGRSASPSKAFWPAPSSVPSPGV